jgi:glyoxylase-like metal-dependent hydrolase (beta-lactamase superfamily II)
MEILPGVDELQLNGSKAHLLAGDGPGGRFTLIDAGLPGSRPRLEKQLASLGRSVNAIGRIVVSHGHPDHVGGVPELVDDEMEILMHPADLIGVQATWADFLRQPSRGRFFASMTPVPPSARVTPVEDGSLIPILGGLRVVHTPGHTPGSICLYAPALRAVFTGDTLEVRGGRLAFANRLYSDDHALARRSVARLAELAIETIVFSHYEPWRGDATSALRELASRA